MSIGQALLTFHYMTFRLVCCLLILMQKTPCRSRCLFYSTGQPGHVIWAYHTSSSRWQDSNQLAKTTDYMAATKQNLSKMYFTLYFTMFVCQILMYTTGSSDLAQREVIYSVMFSFSSIYQYFTCVKYTGKCWIKHNENQSSKQKYKKKLNVF